MKKNNKIVLLFPDGVGIRNYLYSDVFKGMEKQLVLFHAFDAKTEQAVKDITEIQNALPIPKYTESLKEKFLRELICFARLKHNAKLVNNPTVLTNWKTHHKGLFKTLFYKFYNIEHLKLLYSYQPLLDIIEIVNETKIAGVINLRIPLNRIIKSRLSLRITPKIIVELFLRKTFKSFYGF